MNSTPNTDTFDPDAVLAARHPSALPVQRPTRGSPMRRGLVGLVLAALIGAAAFTAQSPYGEAARLTVAQWAPQLISTSSSWLAKPGSFAQPSASGVRLAADETTAALPAQSAQAPAQAPAQDAAPTPAPMPPELAQLLQTITRDLTTVEQGLEQLKANQEQMAADNARAIEQLKASQEQMARLVARPSEKPSEQEPRARTPVPPTRPVAANAAAKPRPTQPPQARAHPQPIQLQPKQQ